MTVTELIAELQRLNEEIGCDGEKIGSHKIKSAVVFYIDDAEVHLSLSDDFELEPTMMMGCGCWDGVRFRLKIVN